MRTNIPNKVSSCLANFLRAVTKPQRGYLLIYLVGLIWLVKFRSIREIAHGSEIFVINVDGTGESRLTPPQQNPKYPNDMFRGWSTDQYPDWHA